MSKHYSCELWEWREEERWRDRQTQTEEYFHIKASTAYGRSKNKYSDANGSASLEFMQT